MTKNTSEADFATHIKIITKGELWDLMDTGRENVKNTRVADDVITRDKTEHSIHALADIVDMKNSNEWIFIMISRTGKR